MSAKREKIKERQLQGFKYFKAISGMLEGLHDAGCKRDKAGNRILHMDQYMSLLLLYRKEKGRKEKRKGIYKLFNERPLLTF
jgi:hypothetical protein